MTGAIATHKLMLQLFFFLYPAVLFRHNCVHLRVHWQIIINARSCYQGIFRSIGTRKLLVRYTAFADARGNCIQAVD